MRPFQDWEPGLPVHVKSVDLDGFLANISNPVARGVQVHADPWNQTFQWVHFPQTGELRLFSIDQLEVD